MLVRLKEVSLEMSGVDRVARLDGPPTLSPDHLRGRAKGSMRAWKAPSERAPLKKSRESIRLKMRTPKGRGSVVLWVLEHFCLSETKFKPGEFQR